MRKVAAHTGRRHFQTKGIGNLGMEGRGRIAAAGRGRLAMRGNGDRVSQWVAGVAGVAVLASLFAVAYAYFTFFRPRTPIWSLREAPASTAVHLIGVVTFTDAANHRFWLEDETGATVIPAPPGSMAVRTGETVAVDALTMEQYDPAAGPAHLHLRNVRIQASRVRIKLPAPFPASTADFPQPDKDGTRVAIEGVIEHQYTDAAGTAWLFLTAGGNDLIATVPQASRNFSRLLNAKVRIVGVAEHVAAANGDPIPHLSVSSASGVALLESPPNGSPLESVRDLYRTDISRLGHRIRVRGRVAAVYPDGILLEDCWGAIRVHFVAAPHLTPGTAVEVIGFPKSDGMSLDLAYSHAQEITAADLEAPPGIPAITTVAALRKLTPEQAAQVLPVQIDGVITFCDRIWRQLYVQDSTGGSYVKFTGEHPELHAGVLVRLTGLSGPGNYAPVIVAAKFVPEGTGPLPIPIAATPELAASGLLDSQFVSIEGIVHPIHFAEQPDHPVFTFELYTSLGQVHVYTSPDFPNLLASGSIEDARVRIRAVFGTIYNSRRQLVGYQAQLATPAEIQILEPAASNAFTMAATPIGSLLRFSPGQRFGHRVKIAGSVTMAHDDFAYVQDESGGVQVRGDARSLHLGERVEAVGYPTLAGRYSPVLTDAVFRTLTGSSSVTPQFTSATVIPHGNYDSQLVTIEGRLLAMVSGSDSIDLLLQSGLQTFTAELDLSHAAGELSDLRPGSILRLTGVASAQIDPNNVYQLLHLEPVGFKLLLRSSQDVKVIRAAPFWNSGRTLALLSLLILVILAWVAVLRRRVARQRIALEKASQTAQAIHDLSAAMEKVSAEQKFDAKVSVRGSEEIAGLVVGFNAMLTQLLEKDTARRDAEARLMLQATIDELTGLPNRRVLSEQLMQSMARARRDKTLIGFLYIDLDGFKMVNDSFGHAAGDRLLVEVGQRLRSRVREADTLARIGGDEFTVILHHINSPADAQRAAECLLQALDPPFHVEGHEITIGASVGISIYPDPTSENDNLLQQADSAMYAAKRNGKNRIVHFSNEIGLSVRERLTMENELRRAVANGEIEVHYQPEFNLATNAIVRFEALARWTHPTLGAVPPVSFIPIAEDCGLIVALGAYVMERACRDAAQWQQSAGAPIQVAVNVSSVQFARETFVDEVIDILTRTGLPANLLQIELTESATLIGIERAASAMRRLKALGIGVVMDDFGSGYSSLSYLPRFPFDALKIDRSFVNELPASGETQALVHSIITLGHNLGMKIVVEGIENTAQLQLMRQLGGDEAQGFLLGRPSAEPLAFLRRDPSQLQTTEATQPIG